MRGDTQLMQELYALLKKHCKRNTCRRHQLETRFETAIQEQQHFERSWVTVLPKEAKNGRSNIQRDSS